MDVNDILKKLVSDRVTIQWEYQMGTRLAYPVYIVRLWDEEGLLGVGNADNPLLAIERAYAHMNSDQKDFLKNPFAVEQWKSIKYKEEHG